MSISWDFYSGRRGVTVKSVLEANSIKSYEDLVNHLKALGVKAPASKVCKHLFSAAAEKMILPTREDIQEMAKSNPGVISELEEDENGFMVAKPATKSRKRPRAAPLKKKRRQTKKET